MIRNFLVAAAVAGVALMGTAGRADDVNVNINSPDTNVRVHNDQPTGQPMLFVMGGGNNSLRDLDEASSSNFNTGYNVGGGVGVQLSRGVALRASYTFSRATAQSTSSAFFSPVAGNDFDRHYYGADLQFRAANDSGFSPYLFVGGGAVTVSPANNALILSPTGAQFANDSFTKPAARAGIGLEYQFPNSGFGIYAEGSGWAYKWDRYGFDRTQVDTNWGGGISYRFGY
jgi:opacity protein-like surface antigen